MGTESDAVRRTKHCVEKDEEEVIEVDLEIARDKTDDMVGDLKRRRRNVTAIKTT